MTRSLSKFVSGGRALALACCCVINSGAVAEQEPKPRSGAVFGDWLFECKAIAEDKARCAFSQTIVNGETQEVLAWLSVGRGSEEDTLILTSIVPLGVDVSVGAELWLDDRAISLPVKTCSKTGCISRVQLSSSDIETFLATSELAILYKYPRVEQPSRVRGSFKGLPEGLRKARYISE